MGEARPIERLSDAPGGRPSRRLAARSFVARFCRDRRGATAIEYGLICGLIFLVIVGAVTTFAHTFTAMMNTTSTTLAGAM
jgi:pilus assembly protein Flp/PilA